MSQKLLKHLGDTFNILIGIMISSLGIYLLYKSGIGSTPLATIADGVANLTGIERGTANIIANLSLLGIALLISKEGFGQGTFITVICIGLFVNMWTWVFGSIVPATELQQQIIYSLLGLILNGFGLSYYVMVNAGFGPLEYITEVFIQKTNQSYRVTKTCVDMILLSIGFFLGGQIGIGTILNVAMTGVVMNFFINTNKERLENQK